MNFIIRPLETLQEAFALASIRNECRHMMTNDQREINQSDQENWFKEIYLQQNPQSYRIWLLIEPNQNSAIGYFAAKETLKGFFITEGISEKNRGQGAGTFLLSKMLSAELFKTKPLYADIFNYNLTSIRLHKKFGFKEEESINDNITRFVLK